MRCPWCTVVFTSCERKLKADELVGVGIGGGARGGAHPPTFQGGGGWKEVSTPHSWAHTYLKIPPRSLFFHPHSSTVLAPNQLVRCFEKFIGVGTWGGGGGGPSAPVFLQCVCGGGGRVAPPAESPFGPVFQCPAI